MRVRTHLWACSPTQAWETWEPHLPKDPILPCRAVSSFGPLVTLGDDTQITSWVYIHPIRISKALEVPAVPWGIWLSCGKLLSICL